MSKAWRNRMYRRLEASSEALYDNVEAFLGTAYEQNKPYLLVFASLLIIWEGLRLLRASGMTGDFLDWMESADKAASVLNMGALLLDEVLTLAVSIYDKRKGGK